MPVGQREGGDVELIATIERYYDEVPRANADAHQVGPFTLFVARQGWQYYARPRLGGSASITSQDVRQVLDVQRERGMPRQIEWVHEVTPSLLRAARGVDVPVLECPLLVLTEPVRAPDDHGCLTAMLEPDDPRFASARAAVAAGFTGTDELRPEPVQPWMAAQARDGLLRVAGAFNADGAAVGGGSHAVRGDVSELTGIAVIPRCRRRGIGASLTKVLTHDAIAAGATTVFLSAGTDVIARVYERVGFRRIGTACIVEVRTSSPHPP